MIRPGDPGGGGRGDEDERCTGYRQDGGELHEPGPLPSPSGAMNG